jgi:hypothetical protein
MAPSQSLIDQAKGVCKQDEPNDEDGGTNHIAAYPSHWGMQPVGFADLLVKA